MLKLIHRTSPLAILICALMLMQLIGCSEDADDDDDADVTEAPLLPPDGSMTVDLSTFNEDGVQQSPAAAQATYLNFTNAVARVKTINSAIVAASASPAALFAAARLYEPELQDDGSWLWSFSVQIDSVMFTAKLTGLTATDITYWSMKVSTDAVLYPVTDFEWYKGTSGKLNTTGTWEFFDMKTPDEQNPTTKIDWSVKILKEEAQLTIENVDSRSEYFGDVLRYNATLEDASLSFDDASKGETWEILWDILGVGSIQVPGYKNGEKACWDAFKQDMEC